jgi:sensor c-di-GMP phosphodiesterase-like protein
MHQRVADRLARENELREAIEQSLVGVDYGAIALAHGLGLRAIAEGIEHPVELDCLRALECDRGQGFLFSRPLDVERTQAFLANWTPTRVAELSHQVTSS